MIIDYVKNIHLYKEVLPRFESYAHVFANYKTLGEGRIDLNATDFVNVVTGQTNPMEQGEFEFHQNYLDIQLIIEGKEQMQWQDLAQLKLSQAYDHSSDIGFAVGQGQVMDINEGMFYVVYPHDAHMPGRHLETQTDFKKAVFKIKVN